MWSGDGDKVSGLLKGRKPPTAGWSREVHREAMGVRSGRCVLGPDRAVPEKNQHCLARCLVPLRQWG